MGGLFRGVECEGDTLRLGPGCHSGACCLPPVDSGETGFSWSRLIVSAELPRDCGLQVYAYASNDPEWRLWARLEEGLKVDANVVRECFGEPQPPGCDFWLSLSGRYLWIAFELSAAGEEQPVIKSFSIRMGGDHMIDYLPAIYQGDDFTYRFVSIFNSMMQDMEDEAEALPRRLYPESTDMLDCLAEWVCMEPGGEDVQTRIGSVLEEYETMYTVAGIKRSVLRLTGKEPFIIEHFEVDPNMDECRNPVLYQRLYGSEPYRFFVLLDEDAFESRDRMEWFLSHMRELVPAETELELVLLKRCVQLDRHTYLGINTYISNYIPAVINETVTIHYDTTIGGNRA